MAGQKILKVYNTRHDFSGFDFLAKLHSEVDSPEVASVILEMGGVDWFSAIMSAPLKVLADRWASDGKVVSIGSNPQSKTYETLCRNRFLCYFGREPISDGYNSSIAVTLFPEKQDTRGAQFLFEEVAKSPYFPRRMTQRYRRSLLTNFSEAFVNVRQHADTSNVAACGQYYLERDRLGIIVADGGVTIPQNVLQHVSPRISPVDSVRWALQRGNTTQKGGIGGDGLAELREFVGRNRGSLTVVSGSVFWRANGKEELGRLMRNPFPGTCVHWEIAVGDDHVYALKGDDERS